MNNTIQALLNITLSEISQNSFIGLNPIPMFLLGMGVALFIALLGWSDQIRTPQRESKKAEKEFMEKHKIEWEDLRYMIREGESITPEKRVVALIRLMDKRKLKNKEIIKQFDRFKNLFKIKERLEKINKLRYDHTIYLTCFLFIVGLISFLLNTILNRIVIVFIIDGIFIIITFIFVFDICSKMFKVNKEDEKFRLLLQKISDEV